MALQGEAQGGADEVRRRANFHPSIWDDFFLKHQPEDKMLVSAWKDEVGVLKEKVRKMLTTPPPAEEKILEKLSLIDAVIRLGIGYHFQKEIDDALLQFLETHQFHGCEDISIIALGFRLLRKGGHYVSSEVFNKFVDAIGNFEENLIKDWLGLLNLYEASYLSVHGEKILDDAVEFTKKHLKSFVNDLPSPVAEQVSHALHRPLPPFFRDRLIEAFFWSLAAFPEPELSLSRMTLAKFGAIFTVIDDIYDTYGTIDELELFTEAIERWDGSIDHLPDYMKVVFHALMELLKQLEEETTKEGRPYCIQYVKEAVKRQFRVYTTGARWFNQGYVPKFEEYRAVTRVSNCLYMLAYQGVSMMPEATKEVYDWLVTDPKILAASGDHSRLLDDIASHEFEQKRGHVASAVECYMKEYGVSKEEAHDAIKKLVEDDWKYMNEGFMKEDGAIPKKILRIFLGYARVMDVLFDQILTEGSFSGFTYADTTTKEMMEALLVNPIPEHRGITDVSTCLYMFTYQIASMMPEATKKVYDWLVTDPKILVAAGDHCRLVDDIQAMSAINLELLCKEEMALHGEAQGGADEVRRSGNFHPSVWGDFFLKREPEDKMLVNAWKDEIGVLKEVVMRKMLTIPPAEDNILEKLSLIDAVVRLGIGYHFQKEIDDALLQILKMDQYHGSEDISTIALGFRLLRQRGHYASYLCVHGEKILDDALEFTKKHLKSLVNDLPSPVAEQVSHALHRPVQRNVEKYEQLLYISIYKRLDAHNEVVLKLAKLNFNVVQSLYREELRSLTKWWIGLDFATKLPPFFRDRLIEAFFWSLAAFPEPELSLSRMTLPKFAAIFTVIDDIYDTYGTIDELELFTEAIERWDGSIDHLPHYMKVVFHALMELLKQLEEETTKEGRPYCIQYVKEAVKRQFRVYTTEARWFNQGFVPKFEEYRAVSGVSNCLHMLAYQSATKEVYDWLVTDPKILAASTDHSRLWDDIASHEFEQKRGHVASAVECYMKEYGVSKEEAHDVIKKLMEDDWKYMNEGFMKEAGAIPKKILRIFLGYARVMDVLFEGSFSGFTYADTSTKEIMEALLVNPLPMLVSAWKDEVGVLKEKVRKLLTTPPPAEENILEKLSLIDAVLRLGIGYHFQKEIDDALLQINKMDEYHGSEDISTIALGFRLLRQRGYYASYLSVPGEKILDDAIEFTKKHLKSLANDLPPPVAEQVNRALHRPVQRNLERWWVELDFARKLPFFRDRLVECFLYWATGPYPDPELALCRRTAAKAAQIFTIIDDIYDAHGIIEEHELFGDTIERWDTSMERLPDYMKLPFQALLDFLKEIEEKTSKEGRSYCMQYIKEAVKRQIRIYTIEARWLNEGCVPKFEEHRGLTRVSTCLYMFTYQSVSMMPEATKEVYDWLVTDPKILVAAGDHCRLLDDVTGHETEQKRGHVASTVECYMKEYGVSKEEAHEVIKKFIEDDWKYINEEFMKEAAAIPKKILKIFLGYARVMEALYGDFSNNGYDVSDTTTKEMMEALLVNPIPGQNMLVSAWTEQVEVLKEEMRKMLTEDADDTLERLKLIDAVLRLGIGYHFEGEIEEALEHIHKMHQYSGDQDLVTVALRFRLLRKHGYYVSSGRKGQLYGKPKPRFGGASFLSMQEEKALDDALDFTKAHLKSMVGQLPSPLAKQVRDALYRPIHWRLQKQEQLNYISQYEQEQAHNEAVLKMAKLDFNIVQALYQEELCNLSKWRIKMDLTRKLPFARDRMIENYYWALAAYPDPEHDFCRIAFTKWASIACILDDMHDAYGTFDELQKFTNTIERWDTSMEDLPEYMKHLFEAIVICLKETEEETTRRGRPYSAEYVKKAVTMQVRAYFTEAKWFNQGHIPTLEEYRQNGVITSVLLLLPTVCVGGMSGASKEMVIASGDHCRLMDDVATHEKRGHVASSVECYMKQYGVSKEEARKEIQKFFENDWKIMNEELIKETAAAAIPKKILRFFINFLRIMEALYKDGFDGYTNAKTVTKEALTAL
ncbi:hypothetical protein Tsubulata_030040, partial [Turnera subulata]